MSRALAGAPAAFSASSAAQASSNAPAAAAPKRLAVVGGGIAGLSAALAAARAAPSGLSVTVFDLGGRGPGGRMSSRQLEQPGLAGALSFDPGAQQVTGIGADFRRELDAWRAAGVVAEWAGRHGRIRPGAFAGLRWGAARGGHAGSRWRVRDACRAALAPLQTGGSRSAQPARRPRGPAALAAPAMPASVDP